MGRWGGWTLTYKEQGYLEMRPIGGFPAIYGLIDVQEMEFISVDGPLVTDNPPITSITGSAGGAEITLMFTVAGVVLPNNDIIKMIHSSITASAIIAGLSYTITSQGTSDFTTIGAPNNLVGTVYLPLVRQQLARGLLPKIMYHWVLMTQ
jgi:hypothetical protein